LYEDDDLLAVNKPAGLLVHGSRSANAEAEGGRAKGGPHIARHGSEERHESTLVDWLLAHRPVVKTVGDDPATRPGIVHRLDRETSGVMIVAKTQAMFDRLKALFAGRDITKTYLAVVRGAMRSERGIIERPIGIVSGSVRRSIHSTKMVKDAVTAYEVKRRVRLANGSEATVLAVYPKTGRTHQIRVHLASLGHPVLGDRLYDKRSRSGDVPARMFLHAAAIALNPESGKRLVIEAPVPAEFAPYLST
jgi:23S rRNA pseudouridine1911/1915/1917 synthase